MSNQYNAIAIILGVICMLLAVASFIVVFALAYQKKRLSLEKNIQTIQAETDRLLLNEKIETQEQTSQHISREIHDNVCMNLTVCKLHMSTLDRTKPELYEEKLALSLQLLGSAMNKLVHISHSLSSELIESKGLLMAVEKEMLALKKSDLYNLEFLVTGKPVSFTKDKELGTFRIIQECLSNIIKHSKATNVSVILLYDDANIKVTVRDDGVGFDIKSREHAGTGIRNMEYRATLLRGQYLLTSAEGNGTSIELSVPYH